MNTTTKQVKKSTGLRTAAKHLGFVSVALVTIAGVVYILSNR